MAKKYTKYYTRKFINKKNGTAFIEVFGINPKSGCTVKIGDCDRVIRLEFWDHTHEEDEKVSREELFYKFNVLISELEKARDWMFPDKNDNKEE